MDTKNKIINRHVPCPVCTSSDGYCEYEDGHGYCFACEHYTPPSGHADPAGEYTYEYLPSRGLSRETLERYNILTKIHNGKPYSVGFLYPDSSTKVRLLDKKEFFWLGSPRPGLFGKDKFAAGSSEFITITEGEFDAASLYQVLGSPVVSVQSSVTALRDVSADFDYVASFDKVYLAFDNDGPGKDALRKVARLFDYNKVFHCRFTNRKDANEFVANGEGSVLKNIWWNSKHYLPETIKSSLADFKDILTKPKKSGIPYPFPTLTKMTYGIRTGETVLIKAPEKVGKTTLMHTLEHHLLETTDDNVAAIFIEEPERDHLERLAGLEIKRPVHLPDQGYSSDDIYESLERLIKKDGRLHIYSHFGSNDPDVLLEEIRFLVAACSCRYVLFDHITMAVSGVADEASERRRLEYLATRLEMMVKELDFSLIMVSHVNDAGQTRGSHYLTKVADIVIDLSRDTLAVDDQTKRTIRVSIPFNRFCHYSGHAGNLVFNPDNYTLAEEAADVPCLISPSILPDDTSQRLEERQLKDYEF